MRNDAGINGGAQRIEQIAWLLFLKVYDTKEEDWEFDDDAYESIIPEDCRCRNWAVDDGNSAMVEAYWQIGKCIVEYEQNGQIRAGYGKSVIKELSKRLTQNFGKGFTSTNLKYMRQFYIAFPKGHAVSDQLSWTHYRKRVPIARSLLALSLSVP